MKVLYILSLVITVIFIGTIGYYANEYQEAYSDMLWNDIFNYSGDNYYSSYDYSAYARMDDVTSEGSMVALVFLLFYTLTFIFTLKNIKRSTAKVISIIGLVLSGLLLLFTMVPAFDPGGVSYDEIGVLLLLYAFVMLGFCITNLVQAVRNESGLKVASSTTIDDI